MADHLHAVCERLGDRYWYHAYSTRDHRLCLVSHSAIFSLSVRIIYFIDSLFLFDVFLGDSEQGFVNGLSTLGMVSGLFGACWSMG